METVMTAFVLSLIALVVGFAALLWELFKIIAEWVRNRRAAQLAEVIANSKVTVINPQAFWSGVK